MRNGTDYNIIVDVPENAHVCTDGRVYVVTEKRYFEDLRYNMDKRVWLGKAISPTQMHPNNNYKDIFADKLQNVPHLNLPVYSKRVGLYAATLSIGVRTGLYSDLVTYLGPRSANLVMDYAVYSILTKSNVAKDFQIEMSDQMLFLGKSYSDTWIQDQIDTVITSSQVQAFKNTWVKHFSDNALSEAWICIDGSNNNCTATIDEAEKGKAKTHRNISIISFLYAVTQDGTPIISQVYRGSRVDGQAIKEMIVTLKGYGISPKGVILDRGFCDEGCIRLLAENNYDYIIMMKENTNGFHQLLERHRDEIRLQWKYALGNGMFGTSDKVKLFQKCSLEVNAALIWDAKNGVDRASYLIDEVMEVMQKAETAILSGKTPVIPVKYKEYLSIVSEPQETRVMMKDDVLQTDILSKGYSGLVCSKELSAREASHIYDLRDSSEKQYSMLKTQLGNHVFRVHKMHGIVVREMIAFVASIIRHEIMKVCQSARPVFDTNKVIKELNLITMNLTPIGRYQTIHNQSQNQKDILRLLSVTVEDLDYIAEYETHRCDQEIVSPVQTLQKKIEPDAEARNTVKIKGIPNGSVARGKGAKQPISTEATIVAPLPKHGPGRPKGSKNKPCDMKSDSIQSRKRGRPKGSKNKPRG